MVLEQLTLESMEEMVNNPTQGEESNKENQTKIQEGRHKKQKRDLASSYSKLQNQPKE